MPVTIEVFEPDNKTYDRTPRVKWDYTDPIQKAYIIHLEYNKGLPDEEILYAADLHSNTNDRQHDLFSPSGGKLKYGNYLLALVVQNQNSVWENASQKFTSYARSSNTVTLTYSSNHSISIGDYIYVYGVGASYDGVFEVTGTTSTTVSYSHTGADYSSSPSNAYTAKAELLEFEIIPVHEKLFYWNINKRTSGDNAALISDIGSPIAGASRLNNVLTITTKDNHKIKAGNAVYINSVVSSAVTPFHGVFRVAEVLDPKTLKLYQSGEDDNSGYSGTVSDFGFEDWPTKTDIDITTDVERVKSSTTSSETGKAAYELNGYYYLRKVSSSNLTQWSYIVFTQAKPTGTAVRIQARVAGDEDELNSLDAEAGWTTNLASGDKIGLVGRVLELRIWLSPNTPERDKTPNVKDLQVSYYVPGSAGGIETKEWNEFVDPSDDIIYYRNTKSEKFGETFAAMLSIEDVVNEYAHNGYIILRHDSQGLNDWRGIQIFGNIPVEDNCGYTLYYKTFNKIYQADDLEWQQAANFTFSSGYPYSYSFPSPIEDKRFMDVKIEFHPSDDYENTPVLTELDFLWTQKVIPTSKYFYTTQIRLPSELANLIITSNADEPDGTEVYYGVCFTNSTNFEADYTLIPAHALAELGSLGNKRIRIGAKLWSGSTTDYPIIHEFAAQLNTENKDIFFLNQGI